MSKYKPEPMHFGVAVTDLTRLSRDLRDVDRDLSQGFTQALKLAVQPVVDAAKTNASFSPRIADSIRMGSTGGRANVRVFVRAGGVRAPEAAAFENMGREGKFRHPVFGNRKAWVEQDAHPYLLPALTENAEAIADDVEKAIDKYLRDHGL